MNNTKKNPEYFKALEAWKDFADNLDDNLEKQVQSHVNDLNALEEENKLKKLLEIAELKGVIFAVNVAKKMDDPYMLDILHDSLAKEGYYKNLKL